MRHVKVRTADDMNEDLFASNIDAAARLNEMLEDTAKTEA